MWEGLLYAVAMSEQLAEAQPGVETGGFEQVITVTGPALAKVIEIRDAEDEPGSLALRIAVTGVSGIDFAYDLAFEPLEGADPGDIRWDEGGLTVLVPVESRDSLKGATLDLPSNPAQGGLVVRNPNRPNPLGDVGTLELTGDLAERVTQLLDQRINPALASHGGFAALVGVEVDTVYVTMGGGCQGCAMSQATLTDGIRAAILEAIPEVTDVVDATDHSAGDNPFFT